MLILTITGVATTATLCQEGRCDCIAEGKCEQCPYKERVSCAASVCYLNVRNLYTATGRVLGNNA